MRDAPLVHLLLHNKLILFSCKYFVAAHAIDNRYSDYQLPIGRQIAMSTSYGGDSSTDDDGFLSYAPNTDPYDLRL